MKNESIIHGTHRTQDLIPAFLDALDTVDSAAYEQLTASPSPLVPAYVYDEGDESAWWGSDDAQCVLEELFDALNNAAPAGFYFGAHPGDGSDFGFWDCDEEY